MFLIALRLIVLIAVSYLFGLLVAWLFSLFDADNGGNDFRRGDGDIPQPPKPGKSLEKAQGKRRFVEVDESYYLEEFDLKKK